MWTSRQKRFFLVSNATALALALGAAMDNAFVGPVNAAMWLLPIFIVVVAASTYFLVGVAQQEASRPRPANWMFRRLFGKRVVYFTRCWFRWNVRATTPLFVYWVPMVMVCGATLLLIAAMRGAIHGSP
jgi:hypothetical protein